MLPASRWKTSLGSRYPVSSWNATMAACADSARSRTNVSWASNGWTRDRRIRIKASRAAATTASSATSGSPCENRTSTTPLSDTRVGSSPDLTSPGEIPTAEAVRSETRSVVEGGLEITDGLRHRSDQRRRAGLRGDDDRRGGGVRRRAGEEQDGRERRRDDHDHHHDPRAPKHQPYVFCDLHAVLPSTTETGRAPLGRAQSLYPSGWIARRAIVAPRASSRPSHRSRIRGSRSTPGASG